MGLTRRSVLRAGVAGLGVTGFAGCLSDVEGFDGEGGYASFFALYDWSREVAGDELSFETPVDVGKSGHGWSPNGNLARDIASSRIFVYIDSPEFPWAQDVADTIERDYDDQVLVVDVLEGTDVLPWEHDGEADHEGEGEDEHDHGETDHGHDHEGEDTHDHGETDHDHHDGSFDPHAWLDPVRAQEMVRTIAEGLADVDPDTAETYESNANAYADRLAAVDTRFEELVADAELEVAVLAGHNSFQYLADRYGFELHAPIGVSPDQRPSESAIAGTIDLIDDRGIDTILYDVFDAPSDDIPPLAETILADSEASAAEPLTPISGTTTDWEDRGWGWIEQMEDVNLASLRTALGAE